MEIETRLRDCVFVGDDDDVEEDDKTRAVNRIFVYYLEPLLNNHFLYAMSPPFVSYVQPYVATFAVVLLKSINYIMNERPYFEK